MSEPKSFQSVLDAVPNVVDYLYANPPKSALNVFTVMMPAEVVRPEFTTWRDEQRSWRETIALHDQSYHMNSLHVRGREALQLFERLGVNSFATFEPGAAKQFVACSPEGYVIGDAILYYLEPEHLLLVGNPASTDWVQFNASAATFDVAARARPDLGAEPRRSAARSTATRWRGRRHYELLERLHGGAAAGDQVLPLRLAHDRGPPRAGDAPQHGRRPGARAVGAVGRPAGGEDGARRGRAASSVCARSARSPTSAPSSSRPGGRFPSPRSTRAPRCATIASG